MIILPRQARDKDWETQKEMHLAFSGAAKAMAAQVRSTAFLRHFYIRNDHFTKTGSGQT